MRLQAARFIEQAMEIAKFARLQIESEFETVQGNEIGEATLHCELEHANELEIETAEANDPQLSGRFFTPFSPEDSFNVFTALKKVWMPLAGAYDENN